jgi:predicted dehydrogenase
VSKSTLRIGVIGLGSVVREIYQHLYFASSFSPMLRIEGIADPNRAALDAFGDEHGIPGDRRYTDYAAMLRELELDAVQVNTPDHLHRGPAVAALERGLDVVVPKPLAASTADAHAMRQAALSRDRLLLVDFHKRDDPRLTAARRLFAAGTYGTFQCATWYMLDKLLVADPNHAPRFFVTPDFAEKNSPISFLTVHMVDALLELVRLRPVRVRAVGFSQKLPALRPVAVRGYDLCDVEVVLEGGGVAHVVTGWHLPNTAHAVTVQSARLIGSEGLVDLALDAAGCRDLAAEGIREHNPLFRNFGADGKVSGYGISHPGKLYELIGRHRSEGLSPAEYAECMSPQAGGFYATRVCEAAERSLAQGRRLESGAVHGVDIELDALLREQLGDAAREYTTS